MSGPSYEQWAKAMEEVSAPSSEAFTAIEWSKKLGLSRDAAGNWVREGLAHGWLVRATIYRHNITGAKKSLVGFAINGTIKNKSVVRRTKSQRAR